MIVNGVKRIGTSLRSGPEFCPRVNATANGSPEILVSAGLPKSVRVKVRYFSISIYYIEVNVLLFQLRYGNVYFQAYHVKITTLLSYRIPRLWFIKIKKKF